MYDGTPVKIGDMPVGEGCPAVFMPEIGTYFDRDLDQAKTTVTFLRDCGVRIVKGEVFHTADIVLDDGQTYSYETLKGSRTERYRDIVARKVMPFDAWRELYGILTDAGIPFVISCYDTESVDFCVDIGAAAIKIASNNIHHLPLMRHSAACGLPVIIDTGRANLSHVALAVETLKAGGCAGVIVNHNPDGHPALAANQNLNIIRTYRSAFGCPVGLACHYKGTEMLFAAIGAGYHLLEKPVCPNPAEADVDSPWAIALSDVPEVMRQVEACGLALGRSYRATICRDEDNLALMGLVAHVDLKPGDRLRRETVSFAWPARGIVARDFDRVAGSQLVVPVEAGQPITWRSVGLDT